MVNLMLEYQKDRLRIIQEILPLLGDNFVLKGGTALKLYYGLDRYSEDIDLDCKSSNMNFLNKLKMHKNFKTWTITIKKDTEMVFRATIDYGAQSSRGAYPLKVEVSNRNKEALRNNLLKVKKVANVNVYDVEELIKMKIFAFNGRDKIRDFYDLGFLLQSYPKYFTQERLFHIKERIFYLGKEELDQLLELENKEHRLKITSHYTDNILKHIEALEKNFIAITQQNNISQKTSRTFKRH